MIAISRPARLRCGAALALLPLLGGCVAALAVPLMTATGILTERKRTRAEVVAALPAANTAALAESASPSTQMTTLTELPPPSGAFAPAQGPWRDFAAYARERASALTAGRPGSSALLTSESALLFQPRTRPCSGREAAVAIDLDPGTGLFSPDASGQAPAEAAAAAAELREAGVIVLWVSQANANDVAGIAEALRSSGLDPTGRDPILLVRNEEERKQVLREEANETVCVVAIAGDRRGDFDELFDYLRDPRLETAFDAQLGAGWFLVPPLSDADAPDAISAGAPPDDDAGR